MMKKRIKEPKKPRKVPVKASVIDMDLKRPRALLEYLRNAPRLKAKTRTAFLSVLYLMPFQKSCLIGRDRISLTIALGSYRPNIMSFIGLGLSLARPVTSLTAIPDGMALISPVD